MIEAEQKSSQLVLGCAQLGLDYGIANSGGKPDFKKALNLIKTAIECGINTFDTAQAYGNSEEVLGKALKELGAQKSARVITKFSPSLNPDNYDELKKSIEDSIEKLGVKKLECLMLHRADWMKYLEDGLGETLCEFREKGIADSLGISVYTPEEALKAFDSDIFDCVQVPCNAWDNRMVKNGVFEFAGNNRKRIYIRSIFLQGLLLMDSAEVAAKLPHATKASEKWEEISSNLQLDKKYLAMAFVKNLDSSLVIGAETPEQVEENAGLYIKSNIDRDVFDMISSDMKSVVNEKIINPVMWE